MWKETTGKMVKVDYDKIRRIENEKIDSDNNSF